MSATRRVEAGASIAGFTLLEMIAVMALVGLLATLALPSPQLTTSRIGLERLALRAASILKADRYAAMRSHAAVTTTIDMDTKEVRSGAMPRSLQAPKDVAMRASVSSRCRASGTSVGVIFYPDGSSCGASLSIVRAGMAFEVRVNWLTGGVELVRS